MQNSMKIWFMGISSLLVLTLALLTPFIVEAGRHGFKGPSVDGMLCRMEARLDLTTEQKEKLRPIMEEEMETMREMRADHRQEMSETHEKFHSEMKKHWERMEIQFAQVLTDEQMDELRKMKEERRERWKEPKERRHRGGFHGPEGDGNR
jgi:Spy/CpxP family protein refolding chaperone